MRGFTTIELLVILGVLTILAVTVFLVLNPGEIRKEAQDAIRMNDMQTLNSVLEVARSPFNTQALDLDGSFSNSCKGQASQKIFVSVPSDNGETPPAAPNGWSWQQVASADLRKVDGTGWVPFNFLGLDEGSNSLISELPVDPINTFASGYYYTYVCSPYEFNAALASQKHSSKETGDGGDASSLFEKGSDLTLSPTRP